VYLDGTDLAEEFDNRLPPGSVAARLLDRFAGGLLTVTHRDAGLVVEGRTDLD